MKGGREHTTVAVPLLRRDECGPPHPARGGGGRWRPASPGPTGFSRWTARVQIQGRSDEITDAAAAVACRAVDDSGNMSPSEGGADDEST